MRYLVDSQNAFIILADISGYTKFIKLHRVSLAHAEKIISDLLESVAEASRNPLVLNEIEGDAANFHALSDNTPEMADGIFEQIRYFFDAFDAALSKVINCNICPCDSCGQAEKLRLKVIVHHGEVAMRKVRQFEKPAGETVILAHRLLKNSIKATEYILMTDDFYQLWGNAAAADFKPGIENCDGIGKVKTWHQIKNAGEHITASESGIGAKLAQLWRYTVYTVKKLFGWGQKGKFKSLEAL